MNKKIVAMALLLGVASAAGPAAAGSGKKAEARDYRATAQRLVTQSAGVREGEVVVISGSSRDEKLLEALAIEVAKAGASPLVILANERVSHALATEVPEKYDSATPKADLALAKLADVVIGVDSDATFGLFADVLPARRAARSKAYEPVSDTYLKRKVRQVSIGNELYPTGWRAKQLDTKRADLARQFWSALNVDYSELQAAGEKIKTQLTGKQLQVTHPNGTDLTVSVEGRPVLISDGIITEEEVKQGNFNAYLPAGEAMVAPVAGSAQGQFVVDKTYHDGMEVRALTLKFERGKLASLSGEGPGFARLKADYDARGAGKELFGYVDIGINPNLAIAPGNKLGNWISAGMVSVGTGNNTWAGGDNNTLYGLGGHLPGCTVKVDGRTVVEKGVLKM